MAVSLWAAAPAAAQSSCTGDASVTTATPPGQPPFPTPFYGSWRVDDPIRDLPSSASVWSLIDTADPFAIADRLDNGGLWGAEPARLGAHGSSWTETRFRLGDLDVTDPAGAGAPLLYPDLEALEAVDVVSALAPVELGGAGPTVALVPRRPGTTWHVSLGAGGNGAALQSAGGASSAPPIARYGSWVNGHFVASGPLVKDRAGLLVAGTLMRWRRLERSDSTAVGGDLGSLLTHLVLTPGPASEVRVLGLVQARRYPYSGRALYANRDVDENDTFWHLQGTWTRHPARGTVWSASGGYQRGVYEPLVSGSDAGGTIDRLTDGPVLALALADAGVRERWDARVAFTPDLSRVAGGRHALRAGIELTVARGRAWPVAPSLVGELVGGVPARVWSFPRGSVSSRRETTVAAYVADHVRVTSRLALEAGLRLETSRGSAAGVSNAIRWSSASPRLSARWTLDRAGVTAVFGGLAVYRQALPLDDFAVGDLPSLGSAAYQWHDLNGDGLVQLPGREIGAVVANIGSLANSIDPRLKQPSTREAVVGIERRLGERFVVRLAGVDRRERNLVGLVNDGVAADDYTRRLVPDPGTDYVGGTTPQLLPVYDRDPASFGRDRYVLTNPAGGATRYQGVELTFETTPGGRLWMQVGATAYRDEGPGGDVGFGVTENDQGVLGAAFAAPNAGTNATGRLFFDRAYVIKWAATYRAPRDVRVGVVARYQDGQPFARLVVVPDLAQGAEAVQAYPRGETRFTYTLTLDARVEKGFEVAGRRVAAALEAFNLLGTANEVEEDVVTGPSFRAQTAVQPPRALRLGFRVEF